MRFDIRPRAAGKTHDLMADIGQNPNAVLLVPSHVYADRLKHAYPDVKCLIVPWENRESIRGMRLEEIRIDNVDQIIEMEVGRVAGSAWDGKLTATASQG